MDNIEINHADCSIVFYVAGFIGRSIATQNKCDSCRYLLIDKERTTLQFENDLPMANLSTEDVEMRKLFDMANRGGLAAPTEYTMVACTLALSYYDQISNNVMNDFLKLSNHFASLRLAVIKIISNCETFSSLAHVKCTEKHALFDRIVRKLYNCCAKNLVKKVNWKFFADANSSVTTRTTRKIKKLISKIECN